MEFQFFRYPFPGYRQGCSSQKYRRIESILRSGCLSLLHPQYIRMFLFNENNKTILQGKKNRRLNSFLLLSVYFLERAPESSCAGVFMGGGGAVPTPGVITQAKSKTRPGQV